MIDTSYQLFKHALFFNYNIELGPPALLIKSPFGGSASLLYRIAEILGLPKPETKEALTASAKYYWDLLIDYPKIIQSINLQPGKYSVPDITRYINDAYNPAISNETYGKLFAITLANNFADYTIEFEVTEMHIAMIKHIGIWYMEYNYAYFLSPKWDKSPPEYAASDAGLLTEKLLEIHSNAVLPENKHVLLNWPTITPDPNRPYGRNYYYWDLEDMHVPNIHADGEYDQDNERIAFSLQREKEIDALFLEATFAMQAMALYGEIRNDQ